MLYTKKGDNGTTKLWNCRQGERLNKCELVFDALGALDELNCQLGFAKVLSARAGDTLFMKNRKVPYADIIENLQQMLFSVQAELAGSPIRVKSEHISYLEEIIFEVETVLPPIHSFVIPGGGEAGAALDISRTVARRAERLALFVGKERDISPDTFRFLNRISSALYALARHANYQEGFTERNPGYG